MKPLRQYLLERRLSLISRLRFEVESLTRMYEGMAADHIRDVLRVQVERTEQRIRDLWANLDEDVRGQELIVLAGAAFVVGAAVILLLGVSL